MANIDQKTVKRVAELAHISLSDDEVERYARELSQIVGYIEQLQELDTSEVESLTQVNGRTNCWREDKVTNPVADDALLKLSPHSKRGLIVVPKVK